VTSTSVNTTTHDDENELLFRRSRLPSVDSTTNKNGSFNALETRNVAESCRDVMHFIYGKPASRLSSFAKTSHSSVHCISSIHLLLWLLSFILLDRIEKLTLEDYCNSVKVFFETKTTTSSTYYYRPKKASDSSCRQDISIEPYAT
jgi:hypothetical protein